MINKVILIISMILIVASFISLDHMRPGENELLTGLFLAVIVVCLLPWLVLLRRLLFKSKPVVSQRWGKIINVLLLIALLGGSMATAGIYLFLKLDNTNTWGGEFLVFGAIAVLVHQIGIGIWAIAFVIQLCRDQWKTTLNNLVIAYYLSVFLLFVKLTS